MKRKHKHISVQLCPADVLRVCGSANPFCENKPQGVWDQLERDCGVKLLKTQSLGPGHLMLDPALCDSAVEIMTLQDNQDNVEGSRGGGGGGGEEIQIK